MWFTYILYIPNDAYKHIICMIYDIRYAHVFVVFYFSVFISLVSHLMELFIVCVPSINLSNIFLHGSRNVLPAQGHWGQIVWILVSCAWQGTFANYTVSKMTFLYARLKNGTYYAVAMSVRPSVCPSVRPSVRPSAFSGLFFNMLWDINLKLGIYIQ